MASKGVIGLVRSLVPGKKEEVVYECRRCGTTLDAATDACPACEADEINCFVI